jgi:hypothetical protein
MNRRLLLAFIGFFAVCAIFVYSYYSMSDVQNPLNVPQETTPSPSAAPSEGAVPSQTPDQAIISIEQKENAQPYCYIGEFNGRLSIYATQNSPTPDIITDIPLSILPAIDQETIRKGFFVYSKAELSKLLEDLGS